MLSLTKGLSKMSVKGAVIGITKSCAAILVVLLLLSVFILATSWGAQTVIGVANKLEIVEIDYQQGTLLTELNLTKLDVIVDNIALTGEEISVNIHFRCLAKMELCFEKIHIEKVSLVEAASKELLEQAIETTIDSDHTLVEFPLSVSITSLEIDYLFIDNPGVDIEFHKIASELALYQSNVDINQPTIKHIAIHAQDKSSSTAKAEETETNEWPLTSLPTIDLPIKLALNGLAIETVDLQVDAQSLHTIDNISLSAEWQTTQATINQFLLHTGEIGAIKLAGTAQLIHPYSLDLVAETTIETMPAWPKVAGTQQHLEIHGDLSDLNLLLTSEGNLTLNAQANINLVDSDLPFTTNITANNLPIPESIRANLEPTFSTVKAQGTKHKQSIEVTSKITGYGYQNASFNLVAEHQNQLVTLNSLSLTDIASESQFVIAGEVNYGEKIHWDINANSSGFTLPAGIENIAGRIQGQLKTTGQWHDGQWQVQVNDTLVTGEINNQAMELSGNIALNENYQLSPSELTLAINGSSVSVQGYSDQQWHVTGQVSVPSLNQWQPDLSGKITGELSIGGNTQQPIFKASAEISHLLWQELSSEQIKLAGQYQPFNEHQTALKITSNRLNWQDLSLNNIISELSGNQAEHLLQTSWQGEQSAQLSLTGNWQNDTQQWFGQLNNTDIAFKSLNIAPSTPINLEFNAITKQGLIKEHCWQGTGLNLCLLQDLIIANQGELSLSLHAELAAITSMLFANELKVDSQVNGQFSAKWQDDKLLETHSQFDISRGTLYVKNQAEQAENNKPTSTSANNHTASLLKVSEWHQGQLSVNLSELGFDTSLLLAPVPTNKDKTAAKSAPFIAIDANYSFEQEHPISGQAIVNQLNIAPIKPFIPEFSALEGLISTNLHFNGPIEHPNVTGKLQLNNALVTSLRSPSSLENINIQADFTGHHARLDGSFAIGSDTAQLSGDADWASNLAIELALDAEQLNIIAPPHVTATISPQISLNLRDHLLKVAGNITVLDGQLLVEELPEGSVSISDDVIFVDENGNEIQKSAKFAIETDVKVTINDSFNVEGQGFIGNLAGQLHVKQQAKQPLQLFGKLQIPKGDYKAYGQKLSVQKGLLSFNGPIDNPLVDLRAVRVISKENITVGIKLSGLAKTPGLEIFSSPSMPQPEKLSYLVRGRGLDSEASGGLGLMIGTTLANSANVIEQLESFNLLSDIEIDGSDGQASISGYLGDRVYLKYGVGIDEPINELTVRLYLLSRLWLETVSSLENSADIYYSFDIE